MNKDVEFWEDLARKVIAGEISLDSLPYRTKMSVQAVIEKLKAEKEVREI